MNKALVLLSSLVFGLIAAAQADERHFTYTYETSVLPEGQWEFEQWLTNSNKRRNEDFSRWDLRSELEYGINSSLSSALYLNAQSTRIESEAESSSEFDFKGVSSEWLYQLVNPNTNPVGLALYGEYSTDGTDHELEGKLLLSRSSDNWHMALNAIYEAEWEKEGGETEREAVLEFTAGLAYQFHKNWSLGLEARQKSAYPDGLDLKGQEFQSWSVGPNVHYGASKYWATFTVLPQVWGNGDGASGNRNLVHEESMEVRLIFGVML